MDTSWMKKEIKEGSKESEEVKEKEDNGYFLDNT
jgi:hypothetical protein